MAREHIMTRPDTSDARIAAAADARRYCARARRRAADNHREQHNDQLMPLRYRYYTKSAPAHELLRAHDCWRERAASMRRRSRAIRCADNTRRTAQVRQERYGEAPSTVTRYFSLFTRYAMMARRAREAAMRRIVRYAPPCERAARKRDVTSAALYALRACVC